MNQILQSPPVQDQPLGWGDQNPDEIGDEENAIKVKLFFYCADKQIRARVFPDEWYTVMEDEYGPDQVTPAFQPWLEFEVCDFATFGEMLLSGLNEVNKRLEEMQSEVRFIENVDLGEEVYDVYMAKKKNGNPKDGEPNWELNQKVKEAGVSDNLFTVVYTTQAIQSLASEKQNERGQSYHAQPESEPLAHPLQHQLQRQAVNESNTGIQIEKKQGLSSSAQFIEAQQQQPYVPDYAAQEEREDSIAPGTLEQARVAQQKAAMSQRSSASLQPSADKCCGGCVIF